ncbi:MFS general substrate transporter [Crucibulum laeve]|uniref:MFS general substrate transporter n=1 Tax=Crucibulum laeve TaxID=68775 RepID=A0A5C3M3W4_9AGAR|nr:MFS general substrate transporter [Crucibulum laeve]
MINEGNGSNVGSTDPSEEKLGIPQSNDQTTVSVTANLAPIKAENIEVTNPRRDIHFWLVFVALSSCSLLSAIDLAGVGTAAPTIVHSLSGNDFTWVSSAYALSSAACVPLSGNLAQIFGRRPIIQLGIIIFAAGSAISASAHTMVILIVGRALQGVGGGIIQALNAIIIADLVPLRERGLFTGITGLTWTFGSAVAPFIAGGLAEKASWRWLFYLNLPLCGISLFVVTIFLRLKKPTESFREKFFKIDWLGNALIMSSACSCMLALTWGGVRFQWSSFRILVPLILGFCGLGFSLLYEFRWAIQPTIPLAVLSNRNSFIGYVVTFISGVVTITIGCKPTWFQAVQGASPVVSGLHFLPWAISISPFAIVQGLIVAKTGRYRLVNLSGWVIMLLGVGLLISLKTNTSIGLLVLYQLIMGAGGGLLYSASFAVLAPLSVSLNAPAVALLVFLRLFSQAWGVALGGTILQNALQEDLPRSLLTQYSDGAQIAYSIVPTIPGMAQPLKSEVQTAFVRGFRVLWIAIEIFCAVGILSIFVMKDIPLRKTVDKRWGLNREEKKVSDSTNER